MPQVLGVEEGHVLPRQKESVEHFGDLGISQPLFAKQAFDAHRRARSPGDVGRHTRVHTKAAHRRQFGETFTSAL